MATNKMNLSSSGTFNTLVDCRDAKRGHGSRSEYVGDLVCKDEREGATEKLRAMIKAGQRSLPGKPWNELRDELLQRTKPLDVV